MSASSRAGKSLAGILLFFFFFFLLPLRPLPLTPPTYWPTLVAYYPYDNDKKFLCPWHVRERLHILSMHTPRGKTWRLN